MMANMQALPADHPEMKAWDKYKSSERYESTLKWPDNTEGNLWGAFDEGWRSAMQTPANTVESPKVHEVLSRDQRDALAAANAFLSAYQSEVFNKDPWISGRVQKIINEISDMLYA